MIDIHQSESYAKYLKSLGWKVERIEKVNYFIKKIPLIGSILKLQRPEKIKMSTINKLCRKYRVFQLIIEPKTESDAKFLFSIGFKLAKSTYLPSKTLQIDLTRSKEKIFSSFKKDTRAAIKRAIVLSQRRERSSHESKEGSGVLIKEYSTPDEIKTWREKWKKTVKFSRFVSSVDQLLKLKKSFPQSHSLFIASHNIFGRIIGGALFTTSSHERSNYITYYWQAFTNKEGRTSLSQYSLLWYGILWAKKNGYKLFDFEGIYDPRFPNKSWLGFTHFKRSFGGTEVSYPGCYTKFIFPQKLRFRFTKE